MYATIFITLTVVLSIHASAPVTSVRWILNAVRRLSPLCSGNHTTARLMLIPSWSWPDRPEKSNIRSESEVTCVFRHAVLIRLSNSVHVDSVFKLNSAVFWIYFWKQLVYSMFCQSVMVSLVLIRSWNLLGVFTWKVAKEKGKCDDNFCQLGLCVSSTWPALAGRPGDI